jgi:hypothetical protein
MNFNNKKQQRVNQLTLDMCYDLTNYFYNIV